ncbi:MAG: UDP-glucose 4-epimerase GalE [Acidobacteria bacterium]|nr:UDP-glucose 4-epimerase GalE [Acidobacteriota bacterium]
MSILVTGGAGYIGSVMVEMLAGRGESVVVLDNLSRGHRAAVEQAIPFYRGDVGDRPLVERIVHAHQVEACIHFAAWIEVGESVLAPASFYQTNAAQSAALLASLVASGVRRFVFSSTCAVYGEPRTVPIPEDHPQWPRNPYGWSKFFTERMLGDCDAAYGLKSVSLRYFNAAGATAGCGEDHHPETHLIPNVLLAALGRRPQVAVFGGDYPTPDGTAIRDYVHVVDLCSAHLLALDYLRAGGASDFLNLGNGTGYSVLEVIETARRVTGRAIPARIEARRAGDAVRLVASAERVRRVLGWQPAWPGLDSMIRTAWDWRQAHPDGYPKGS